MNVNFIRNFIRSLAQPKDKNPPLNTLIQEVRTTFPSAYAEEDYDGLWDVWHLKGSHWEILGFGKTQYDAWLYAANRTKMLRSDGVSRTNSHGEDADLHGGNN